MHVLHIDEQMTWRGGEQQACWLIQGLINKGFKIFAVGKKDSEFIKKLNTISGVITITLPLSSEFDLYSAWKIAQIAKKEKIDIIHAHTSHAHSIAIISKLFYNKPKIVVSRRVSFPPHNNFVSKWKYNHVDIILPVSFYVAKILKENNIPEQKICVVRSSIDLSHIQNQPYSKSNFNIDNNTYVLFNAGALVPHKDQITLIKAFKKVLKQIPNCMLLIAGDGPLKETLQKEITANDLEGNVLLLGYRKDIPQIIKMSDVYVSSSWSEGLGTSVLEALACEKPVVATEAGGVPEMVINNKTGLLVPAQNPTLLAEAITYILKNPQKALDMAKQGKKHIEDYFTVQRMVEETISVYQKLIE
ncbi:MAG TPA: glycosyltransferase family 4 protein [Candidatus Hydrogenedens sp.]|nr:glycosyltransferase family 4 protein [Candidatus Hydrogenedens sp.]HOK08509.1 glycosyltransferase family 4 protein [Candidatus Hydrogenedens sp.]